MEARSSCARSWEAIRQGIAPLRRPVNNGKNKVPLTGWQPKHCCFSHTIHYETLPFESEPPPGSPQRERREYDHYPNPLPAITSLATRFPIARAPGFLRTPDATRPEPQRLPPGSPQRERREYDHYPNPLHTPRCSLLQIEEPPEGLE